MSIFIKPKKPSEYMSGLITCCFCERLCFDAHTDSQYHSNNADCENEKDRCCQECNMSKVLPHRMKAMGMLG
jgi:hypothetical protein